MNTRQPTTFYNFGLPQDAIIVILSVAVYTRCMPLHKVGSKLTLVCPLWQVSEASTPVIKDTEVNAVWVGWGLCCGRMVGSNSWASFWGSTSGGGNDRNHSGDQQQQYCHQGSHDWMCSAPTQWNKNHKSHDVMELWKVWHNLLVEMIGS